MYKIICFYISLFLLSSTSFSKTIELNKGHSFSLAYDFHYVESIKASDKMFQNRRIIKKTFSIPKNISSKKKIAFIPFNVLKPGRYQFQTNIKPVEEVFSLVKYYLVATDNPKKTAELKGIEKTILFNQLEARKFIQKNNYYHFRSESYDDDCKSKLFSLNTLRCSKLYMNQYKNLNWGLFNEIKVVANIGRENEKYIGLIIEFDKPINEYNIQNSVIYEDEGQSNVMGNSKYPNFIDHIPLSYPTEKSLDSFVGIKSVGNSSYLFKIYFKENKGNYFSYKLARLSGLTSKENKIGSFSFNTTVSCDGNIAINKENVFNQKGIKHFDSIFFEENLEIPSKCNGKVVTIELTTAFKNKSSEDTLFIVDPVVSNRSDEKRPNVIFITADAMRYDHTSLSNYGRDTTPFLKVFAKNGVSLSRYIVQRGFTQTSFPIIFTGKYPYNLNPMKSYEIQQKKYFKTDLHKILFENGYQTYGIIGAKFFGKFSMGNIFLNRSSFTSNESDQISFMRGFQFIKNAAPGKPYFLWIHLKKPHLPYGVNAKHKKFSATFPLKKFGQNDKIEILSKKFVPSSVIENIKALYDDNIYNFDQQLAQFISQLNRNQLLDNTLLVVSSDHGENMDEHGQYFQHGTLSNACLRVPMVMVYPGIIPRGLDINSLVESVDVLPTILDLLSIKHPVGLDGKSFVNIFNNPKLIHKKYAYSDLDKKFFAIQDDRYKLIINPKEESIQGVNFFFPYTHEKVELYDLISDPLEKKNVFNRHPDVAFYMLDQLLRYKNNFDASSKEIKYSAEILKLLERTGYLHWKKKAIEKQ